MEDSDKLGSAMVEAGLISQLQLNQAKELQGDLGGSLSHIVVKLGYVDENSLLEFVSKDQNLPIVDLDELILPENLVKRIPQKLIEKHLVLPIEFHEGMLKVATSNPYDFEAIQDLQMTLNSKIEVNLARRSQLVKTINQIFHPEPTAAEERAEGVSREKLKGMVDALIPLLIEKGVISEEELRVKARELGISDEKGTG